MKTHKPLLIIALFLAGISSLRALKPESGTIADIDGNVYHIVANGHFVWTAENLKTTSYNDGIKIPDIADNLLWTGLTTGAYCWYNNDEGNEKNYGALYNWHAVNTGRLCPAGWRVPSDQEWKELGGIVDTHSFFALHGGERGGKGNFHLAGRSGFWWSSTSADDSSAWYRNMIYGLEDINRNTHPKWMGFSVRCIRDRGDS